MHKNDSVNFPEVSQKIVILKKVVSERWCRDSNPQQAICEPHREKTGFMCLTAQLICAFVFATQILQFLFFLNPKFQASSHLLWLHRSVCVGLVGNPEDRFSRIAAHFTTSLYLQVHSV